MNPVLQAIESRRSVRRFKPDMVPAELLDQVLQAGTYAATGMGRQSPIILAVTDPKVRDQLSRMCAAIMGSDKDPFYGAPVVLVVLADKSRPTCVYDGSLVMGNLMLAAHSLGLGSCWIHRAKEEFESPEGKALLTSLGIQGEYEGIGHCILGYPEGELPQPAPRKENWIYRI
ncbi:MAG TPA: nitroreductase [Candidatus Anaerofilum excrementigallinarum]|nr:nitroreductase [Candidatus Anaerofilum excrementigallinarum]